MPRLAQWGSSGAQIKAVKSLQKICSCTAVWQRVKRRLPGLGLTAWEQGRKQARRQTHPDSQVPTVQSFLAVHTDGKLH